MYDTQRLKIKLYQPEHSLKFYFKFQLKLLLSSDDCEYKHAGFYTFVAAKEETHFKCATLFSLVPVRSLDPLNVAVFHYFLTFMDQTNQKND